MPQPRERSNTGDVGRLSGYRPSETTVGLVGISSLGNISQHSDNTALSDSSYANTLASTYQGEEYRRGQDRGQSVHIGVMGGSRGGDIIFAMVWCNHHNVITMIT